MRTRRAATAGGALATVLAVAGCGPVCPDLSICCIAGTGDLGFNGEEGLTARHTRLASPTSVAVDPDGRPAVVDYSNMRIRVLEGDALVTVAGNGIHAYSEPGAPALGTPLENPVDAAWGPDGLLYIVPQHEGRMIRIGPDGRVERVVGTGELGDEGDGGDALDAKLGFCNGLALAEDGTIYVADNTHGRVRRVTPDGTIDTLLGIGAQGTGEVPGYGPDIALRSPERLALDGDRLLVADAQNHRVLAVDLDTLQTTAFAGTGEPGYAGDGGDAAEARLNAPTGLTVAADGAVLIGDLGNDAVRIVYPDGTIDTVVGGVDGDPHLAGRPDDFPIRRPAGMAFLPDGDLLIAERGGHRLLRWDGASDAL